MAYRVCAARVKCLSPLLCSGFLEGVEVRSVVGCVCKTFLYGKQGGLNVGTLLNGRLVWSGLW